MTTTAITVGPTLSKAAKAILESMEDPRALDDLSDYPDFMPYDKPFVTVIELVGCEAKESGESNEGIFLTVKVHESNSPEVLVNKTYSIALFTKHKQLPDQVLKTHARQRRQLASTLARKPNDDDFKPMPVFLKLHQATVGNPGESLGIRLKLENRFVRRTNKGKDIHEYHFELV